jgi:L-threonylcarbamoyladenylate synthase
MTARIVPDGPAGRAEAARVLLDGGLIALPTDTIYGVAAALSAPDGVERLFAAKRRGPDKPVALLVGSAAQAEIIGEMTPLARALAARLWPGGLTIVVPQRNAIGLPAALTGGLTTIGLRAPAHDAPRTLAYAVGALPVTSANISGMPEARTAREIDDQLGDVLDLILDGGPASDGPASTVVDCTGDRAVILRAGAIPASQIDEVLTFAGLDPTLPMGR